MEDPIFAPWSVDDPALQESGRRDRPEEASPQPNATAEAADVLRAVAVPRLEAIARRLAVARHRAAIQDLLDQEPRLLRFELGPWAPFSGTGPGGPAMLEIGLGTASDELVTAWYWLDRDESPDEVVSVPTATLAASWVDRVILDFVAKALARR